MQVLEAHLKGKSNPVEEYFFNGHTMSYTGPCKFCGYESLSILDFATFDLNFDNDGGSWFRYSSPSLESMIDGYFKTSTVEARCKNPKCDKYPVNIMDN
jgi:hypothetical protein